MRILEKYSNNRINKNEADCDKNVIILCNIIYLYFAALWFLVIIAIFVVSYVVRLKTPSSFWINKIIKLLLW